MCNNKKNNTHESTYQSQKKVSWAMKLLPISFFSKIIHFFLKKIKCYTSHLFFPCHFGQIENLTQIEKQRQIYFFSCYFFSFGFTIYNINQTKKHIQDFSCLVHRIPAITCFHTLVFIKVFVVLLSYVFGKSS